jgi:hypothetical protein
MQENNNPQIVLDTIIETPKTFGDVTIGDITILKYSYLEKIDSPFINADKEFSVGNVIPSVFILANDKKTLRKYGTDIESLKLDALEWADDHLNIADVPDIISAIVDKFTTMNKAAPSGSGDDGDSKKK